ncbi:MAG: hypothetical protein SFU86_25795 [Pirellulaceae bacterium]|nr:hypothetical protein [Pirellulaceae bacterium]
MNHLPNCDQVFEVLTRGPFPTGQASDAAVERHLRACHDCRQLAEALQPAVELLHESLAPEQSLDLPEYQGLLASVERAIATEQAPQQVRPQVRKVVRPERRPSAAPSAALGAFRLVAATVLLSALATLLWGLATTSRQAVAGRAPLILAPASATRPAVQIDNQGLVTLASLQLPAGCVPRDLLVQAGRVQPLEIASGTSVLCCTICHRAGQEARAGERALAAVQKSCAACHSL